MMSLWHRHRCWFGAVSLVLAALMVGCASEMPVSPTSTPTPTLSVTKPPTFTPIPTWTPYLTPTQAAVSPELAARAAALGRGVNLGNALEAPTEGEWGMVLEADFFALISDAGFDTVRVPIRWSAHAAETAPYTVDEDFFARIDWVIDQSLANDLNVVINMHHYEELFDDPEVHDDRFVAIWHQIAERYEPRPDTLYFELLNEPHGNLDAGWWNVLMARTIETVRAIDDHHTLVLTGADWGGLDGLDLLQIPAGEDNAIVTFHFYDPFLFTHQGADWAGAGTETLGVTWPGPPESEVTPSPESSEVEWVRTWFARYNQTSGSANPAGPEAIEKAFDRASEWSESRGIPLWLGEFGAYDRADMASRVRWTRTVRAAAESRGIPWAYWEFGAGFGIYDRDARVWRTSLLEALVPDP